MRAIMILNKLVYLAMFCSTTSGVMASTPITKEEKGSSFGKLVDSYVKGRKAHPEGVYNLLTQYVGEDRKVLDIGCGTGLSTGPLFTRFKDVRGIDHDPLMLQAAKQNEATKDRFDVGSVYSLPYAEGSFGLVTMFAAYHWFCNDEATKEIARVLEKDGFVCVVQSANVGIDRKVRTEIIESVIGYEMTDPRHDFEPQKVLERNGFKEVVSTGIECEYHYTIGEAIEHVQSTSAWNDVKQSGKQQEVTEALQAYLKTIASEDGLVHKTNVAKVFLYQKKS